MLTAVRAAIAEPEGTFLSEEKNRRRRQGNEKNETNLEEEERKGQSSKAAGEAAVIARLLGRVQELETDLEQERAAKHLCGIAEELLEGVGTNGRQECSAPVTVAGLQRQLEDAEEARAQATCAMDASNKRLAEVEGKLSEYWQELVDEGADLDQIQEEHRMQDEKIAEYEFLLQQTSTEVEELRSELRAKQYVDECLQEYEVENERLVTQLSAANNTIQQLRISIALELDSSAESRKDRMVMDFDDAKEAEVREAELEKRCTERDEKIRMLTAQLQEAEAHVQAAPDASDEQTKDSHEFEQAIESFRLEEAALHDEIEVTKALLEGKELMLSDNARLFQYELDSLREEIQQVSAERDLFAARCPETPERKPTPVKLLLEINRADREIALVPKSELRIHLNTTITVIDALSGDLGELESAYKAVVKAGSDVTSEKIKAKPRNPLMKFHQKFLSAVEKAAASAVGPKPKADPTKLSPPDSKQVARPEHAPTRYEQLIKVKEVYEHHAAAIQDRLQRSTARAQESIRKMIGFTEV